MVSTNFYNSSHYFNQQGEVYQTIDASNLKPELISLRLKDDRIVCIFLANNPWRAISDLTEQKVYQYCIFCGAKRFEDTFFNESIESYYNVLNRITIGGSENLITCAQHTCAEQWLDFADHIGQEKCSAILSIGKADSLKNIITIDKPYIAQKNIKSARNI